MRAGLRGQDLGLSGRVVCDESLRLALEALRGREVRGTLRLEERDCRPAADEEEAKAWRPRPGDLGSGVREMETPEMKRVGDFGMPVSDSYSLELSVSKA